MQFRSFKSSHGYTILEVLISVVIVGILCAIAAPSWQAFLTRQRLNAAQSEALAIMRDVQANAKREKRVWETCFRQNNSESKVQWSVHPAPQSGEAICTNARWQNLTGADADKITIDMTSASRSTLYPHPQTSTVYRLQFNHKGWVNGQMGRITFTTRNQTNNSPRRCVVVSTLLGVLRTAQDRQCRSD